MPRRNRAWSRAAAAGARWGGHPPAGRREHRVRFWEAIARGASSENAAVEAGVLPSIGVRWFRKGGGMPPLDLAPVSGRYLSFCERRRSRSCSPVVRGCERSRVGDHSPTYGASGACACIPPRCAISVKASAEARASRCWRASVARPASRGERRLRLHPAKVRDLRQGVGSGARQQVLARERGSPRLTRGQDSAGHVSSPLPCASRRRCVPAAPARPSARA